MFVVYFFSYTNIKHNAESSKSANLSFIFDRPIIHKTVKYIDQC